MRMHLPLVGGEVMMYSNVSWIGLSLDPKDTVYEKDVKPVNI